MYYPRFCQVSNGNKLIFDESLIIYFWYTLTFYIGKTQSSSIPKCDEVDGKRLSRKSVFWQYKELKAGGGMTLNGFSIKQTHKAFEE